MINFKMLLPSRFKKKIKIKRQIFITKKAHKKRIEEIQKKKRIKVAFLLINLAKWKYEELYFLLLKDNRFDPVVFICPFTEVDNSIKQMELEKTFIHLKKSGYNVQNTLNANGEYKDIKKEFQPDLVFFTTPWNHTLKKYRIDHFLNILTCYVPYAFMTINNPPIHFNRNLHNFCWRFFIETDFHKKLAQKHSFKKGKNVVVSGYPGIDQLLTKELKFENVWKKQIEKKIKIIWAPHHTIPLPKAVRKASTFFNFSDFMLEIAVKYKNELQIAFKPHPDLKGKLYKTWGEKKTENYYRKWVNLENGQLEEGDYIDLFKSSDAMFHDSGSFTIEYLYTDKPVLYLLNSKEVYEENNLIGQKALDVHYHGNTKDDILQFITKVVLLKDDKLKQQRKNFIKNIQPPNNRTATKNIYEYLLKELNSKTE